MPSFKTPKASPYTGDKLTEIEKISYQCKTTYRGDIRHLFLFYQFDERLDAWERENHPQNKGSSNKNPLYRLAIDEFYEVYGFYPKTISVDRGMDSAANNEYSIRKGIYAYIQARDFGNRELVKTEKGKCFRPEYISVNDPSFLERIADRRSECERSFGRDECGYRRDEMSNWGAIEAELYMFITGITTDLTAITAYHVGRTDLMRSPTAFRRISLD